MAFRGILTQMTLGLFVGVIAIALIVIFIRQENNMNDFSKLTAAVTALNSKLDAFLASVPADTQPQIDEATAAVESTTAKIPG